MLQLLVTIGGSVQDYSVFCDWTKLKIEEKINVPSQCSFSLTPSKSTFVVPPERAYVQVYSSRWNRSLFSGYISSHPVRTYLAPHQIAVVDSSLPADESVLGRRQLFQYDITCTSDEHLLNIKAVPFIPSYVNRSQGDILSSLAEILCPGFFDASMVASGDLVPFFDYDPAHSWSEIAKTFADGSRYRYKVRDKKIWYQPYGDEPLGIDYDEFSAGRFAPKDLNTTVLAVPLVNDVTIIGDVEAGNNREDYFIGDGFTGNFPLKHKVFHGSSTLLLQEKWDSPELNTQQWFLEDPGTNFDFSAGALNIVSLSSGDQFVDLGESYLAMKNGVEIAGGIDCEGGEFIFNDFCHGVLNGLYTDTTFGRNTLIAGFAVSSTGGITTSASGAAGIAIQPWFVPSGSAPAPTGSLPGMAVGLPVITKINHTYVLQMVITAPRYVRYDRVYRTVDGEEFGGGVSEIVGTVTYNIQEYDIGAATGFFYTPKVYTSTIEHVALPPFAVYALANQQTLNITDRYTTVATMPLGSLTAYVGPSGLFMPTGLILPMLPQGSGGYIGGVQPWPAMASGNILPPPGQLGTGQMSLVMGNGYQLQAAQITEGQNADTLGFYAQSLPAAGTPVRLQTWEAQAAVSRLQVEQSIIDEAFIVGDDGIRSAIITDLNPLPRTSEDCDRAALAYLKDRNSIFYNGSYNVTSLFFDGLTSDEQFWPTVGRFLNVNAPRRGIIDQKMLVTGLTMTVKTAPEELIQFSIQFGADLYLEKVLKNFVDLRPPSVLSPQDKANPPNPRFTQDVDSTFVEDLHNLQAIAIRDDTASFQVFDSYFGPIEVRLQDTNWGRGKTADYVTTVLGPQFGLQRRQYDQTWYMRPVLPTTGAPEISGDPIVSGFITSRRSKVMRVAYPRKPSPPTFVYAQAIVAATTGASTQNTFAFQLDYNGDRRNIYGFEMRGADNTTILVQKPVASYADLYVDLSQTPYLFTPSISGDNNLFAYFFNLNWSYSDPLNLGPIINALRPGPIDFVPMLRQYRQIGVSGMHFVGGNTDVSQLQEFHLALAYIDEDKASHLYAALGSNLDGVTDPVPLPSAITDDPTIYQFNERDYVAFNDPQDSGEILDSNPSTEFYGVVGSSTRSYEFGQIVMTGGILQIRRHYPGSASGRATFESFMSPHPAGTRIYKVSQQHFPIKISEGAFGTDPPDSPNGFAGEHYVTWPDACVVAVLGSLRNQFGFGPTTVVCTHFLAYPFPGNVHQNPPAPGMRTLAGTAYKLPYAGEAVLGVGLPVRVQLEGENMPMISYANSSSASSGSMAIFNGPLGPITDASLVIAVLYIEPKLATGSDGDRLVGIVDVVHIKEGQLASYDPEDMPRDRRMPYDVNWPTDTIGVVGRLSDLYNPDGSFKPAALPLVITSEIIMGQGGELDTIPILVGTDTAGSNIMIVLKM